jgi:CheY-like chemotaxis protein
MNEARGDIAHPGSSPRILVVEDEPDLALLLAYNLEAEG